MIQLTKEDKINFLQETLVEIKRCMVYEPDSNFFLCNELQCLYNKINGIYTHNADELRLMLPELYTFDKINYSQYVWAKYDVETGELIVSAKKMNLNRIKILELTLEKVINNN